MLHKTVKIVLITLGICVGILVLLYGAMIIITLPTYQQRNEVRYAKKTIKSNKIERTVRQEMNLISPNLQYRYEAKKDDLFDDFDQIEDPTITTTVLLLGNPTVKIHPVFDVVTVHHKIHLQAEDITKNKVNNSDLDIKMLTKLWHKCYSEASFRSFKTNHAKVSFTTEFDNLNHSVTGDYLHGNFGSMKPNFIQRAKRYYFWGINRHENSNDPALSVDANMNNDRLHWTRKRKMVILKMIYQKNHLPENVVFAISFEKNNAEVANGTVVKGDHGKLIYWQAKND
ncbi:hypothetical protein GA840_05525 [Pediococcus ethanolidurans]|uniref:hypothetical protein n=1 Tax=Pediococcus ethanolidurans TaxID=319653 RepID=UPI0029534185|nr:hypothetical protein [Pediococcus ethanolidurans]MDV7719310.1 hypothetical protein [Pediococcus ethanolidurans]